MNCSQLYLGSDSEIDIVDGDNFSIEAIGSSEPEYACLSLALSKKYIYYLAPHTGCGCGWAVLNIETESDEKSKASVAALHKFLRRLELVHPFSVISCPSEFKQAVVEEVVSVSSHDFIKNIDRFRVPFASNIFKVLVFSD